MVLFNNKDFSSEETQFLLENDLTVIVFLVSAEQQIGQLFSFQKCNARNKHSTLNQVTVRFIPAIPHNNGVF